MGDVASCGCLSKDDDVVDVPLKDINDMPSSDDTKNTEADPKVPRLALGGLNGDTANAIARAPSKQERDASVLDPFTADTPNSSRCAANRASAVAALSQLREGNIKFLSGVVSHQGSNRCKPIAFISCCTPPPLPLEIIFGVGVGTIGCTASASMNLCEVDDGSAAAIEFSLVTQHGVSLVIVLETMTEDETPQMAKARVSTATQCLFRNSEYICGGVRKGNVFVQMALLDLSSGQVQFLGDHPDQASLLLKRQNEEQTIITLQPGPIGVSDEQGIITHVQERGQAQQKGVKLGFKILAVDSQKCDSFNDDLFQDAMSGRKPYQLTFKVPEEMTKKIPVSAEEGLAMLKFGNARAVTKIMNSARNYTSPRGSPRGSGVVGGTNYNPFALVYMSFDPHNGEAPLVEVMFDVDPTRIATIPTFARNKKQAEEVNEPDEIERWEGYIHFTEHCLAVNSPRLLVVLGKVLADASAVEKNLAEDQVFREMSFLLERSKKVKAGIADGQLLLQGAIYIGRQQKPPGHVEWLGEHPRQIELLDKMYYPGSSQILSTRDLLPDQQVDQPNNLGHRVDAAVAVLRIGNDRYVSGSQNVSDGWSRSAFTGNEATNREPVAFVLSGAVGETRAPELLFDVGLGELIVHRTCGAISGRREACALTGLEKMVERNADVPLLVILGDVNDPVTAMAAAQAQRILDSLKPAQAQMVIDQFGPVMEQALAIVRPQEEIQHQQQQELLTVATEHHVFYVLERLLLDSDVIMELVCTGRLEVVCAVAQADGLVDFKGAHPDLRRLVDLREKAKRHKRKGIGLGK